jgi:hypothetical protein
MSIIQPYFRHISVIIFFLFCAIFLIWFSRRFFKDEELKKFIIGSITDPSTKVASGKSLTAMILSMVVAISAIIAVIYSPSHILPDSFLNSILIFIASLYSIKVAGNKFGISANGNGNGSSDDATKKDDIIPTT